MALIKCPECKGKVSSQAPVCPHCGYPINPQAVAPPQYAAAPQPEEEDPNAPPSYPGKPYHWSDRVPVAFLLFWGGLILGMIGGGDLVDSLNSEHGVQAADRSFLGWIAWCMIIGAVVWFVRKNTDSYMHYRRWKQGVLAELDAREAAQKEADASN